MRQFLQAVQVIDLTSFLTINPPMQYKTFSINSKCCFSSNCWANICSDGVKPLFAVHISSSTNGALCFLLWKIGIIPEERSQNSMQLIFSMPLLHFWITFFLVHISVEDCLDCCSNHLWILCRKITIQCDPVRNYYVKMYLNGFAGSLNISSDISIIDLIVAEKPIVNVFRLWVDSSFLCPPVNVTRLSK